jgi:transglutaminase-like putative cysteine protease
MACSILDWQLELPVAAHRSTDSYGNILHVLTLDYPHQEIRIKVSGTVETEDTAPVCDSLPPLFFLRQTELTTPDDALRNFAAAIASRYPA